MKYTLEKNGEPEHHIFCATREDVQAVAAAVHEKPWKELHADGYRVVNFKESLFKHAHKSN